MWLIQSVLALPCIKNPLKILALFFLEKNHGRTRQGFIYAVYTNVIGPDVYKKLAQDPSSVFSFLKRVIVQVLIPGGATGLWVMRQNLSPPGTNVSRETFAQSKDLFFEKLVGPCGPA